ncbi:S41 family peptidase [Sphingomonas sp. BAUL-RG-20F-R05-02]|uniref:S41 family peptidase n=1 Tax=Sphingomonas sp. BAUL-RG-20F-R05-02 TaxID=2914830 RepID=UPI001F57A043|nr:S41 family peptidase [Sphingomonas sp. BAUL-RG-20F-R05-02]
MVNPTDPSFPKRLEAARQRGLVLAHRTRNQAGLQATLGAFSAVLRDGHAEAFVEPIISSTVRWPGFVAAWRGDALYVYASQMPDVEKGARVLGCDGLDTPSLVVRNVFAFRGRPDEAGQWWSQARNLFQDEGNPFVKLPGRCRFSVSGKVAQVKLRWRPVDETYKKWRTLSYNGDVLPVGLTGSHGKLTWIALPTFDPDDTQRAMYRNMFAEIARRRATMLAGDAVVIDLRGNQGGSSLWSEQLARALWGSAPVDRIEASDPSRVWWRASRGNTNYAATMVKQLAMEQPEAEGWITAVWEGMRAALASDRAFYVEPATPTATKKTTQPSLPPIGLPVYVIVPGQCASACLDALDLFTRLPHTRLIGAPSSADSIYLDVRVESLPDGLAKVVVPMKLYRDRPRAAGQIYRPAIEVHDLSWSTEAFERSIEEDLKRQRPTQLSTYTKL